MKRGEVWTVELDPTLGHEQAGRCPALILSVDEFNESPADLVTLLPITSEPRQLLTRIPITPPEGGLRFQSWVICEQVRTVSKRRLVSCSGRITPATLAAVTDIVGLLLGFR
jgi:mRNA interferase MazF